MASDTKRNEGSIESQLKSIQSAITEPGKKVAGTIGHYLDALNPLVKSQTPKDEKNDKPVVKTQKHNNITWIDIKNPTRKETADIAKDYFFNTFHLKAALARGQMARIEFEEKYVFILLNFPRSESFENKIITSQLCIFLGKNYLITMHSGKPESLQTIFDSCVHRKEEREEFFKKNAGYLFYNIMDVFVKDISEILHKTSHELDEIEDLVFDIKVSATYKISLLRQKIMRLRRIIGNMKLISENLSTDKSGVSGDGMQRYFKNIYNSLNKLWETLEEVRETVEIYKDTDFTVSSEKTNKILAVLTIIFTLTIPLTILGTFYGMNIFLPGGIESEPWMFWGEYTTFIVILGISAFSILIMLWYFKYKDWF